MSDVKKKYGHIRRVKLSEIVNLSDDIKFHGQEAGCLWMEDKFVKEHLNKRNSAHTKLVEALRALIEHHYLEIDI